jgi:hypothetical protein
MKRMRYFITNEETKKNVQIIFSVDISGVTRIFRRMGKLLLYREKTMGKMGKIFVDRPKLFWPIKVLIT